MASRRPRAPGRFAALGAVAGTAWLVALTSPRAVEDRMERLTTPLLESAAQLHLVARPSQQIFVDVRRPPPGLRVLVDGQPASIPVALVRGTTAYRFRFEAAGYRPYETWLDGVSDHTLDLPLRPAPRARP